MFSIRILIVVILNQFKSKIERYFMQVLSRFRVAIWCLVLSSTPLLATNTLADLLEDFKNYTTTNIEFHSGDLYQHSMWVANAVTHFAQEGSLWVEGLSPHDLRIACFAAIIHDMGKAGDGVYSYSDKPLHPREGFDDLIGTRAYQLAGGGTFDFKAMFDSLDLDENDQALIKVLAGSHWNFGQVMKEEKNIRSWGNQTAPLIPQALLISDS